MTVEPQGRAVVYCRISDKSQDSRGDGLAGQEGASRAYAALRGLEVDRVFRDTKTGASSSRLAMNEMLEFLGRNRSVGYFVVIDNGDRLARDIEKYWPLRRKIAKAGGTLICPVQTFGDLPGDKFMENIRASAAQYERENNAVRTKERMRQRALKGRWPFACPMGYSYVAKKGDGKVLVRNEPLASILTEALEGFASNRFVTQADVGRFLASRPEFPLNKYQRVLADVVKQILSRPIYCGVIHNEKWQINMVPGLHEPLISHATYRAIQNKLNGNAKFRPRQHEELFPLRGTVLCTCGTPLTACLSRSSTGKRYGYYLCPDKSKTCVNYGKSIPKPKSKRSSKRW